MARFEPPADRPQRLEPQDWDGGSEPDLTPKPPKKKGWMGGLVAIIVIFTCGVLSVFAVQGVMDLLRRCW